MIPDCPGGGTVSWTNPWGEHKYIKSIEDREDGGTPGFLQTIKTALAIRLKEEMGMTASLAPLFSFIYRAELENNLVEHELDHVLIGFTDEQPLINPDEVCDYKWISMHEIEDDIEKNESHYTAWFKKIVLEYKSAFVDLLTV